MGVKTTRAQGVSNEGFGADLAEAGKQLGLSPGRAPQKLTDYGPGSSWYEIPFSRRARNLRRAVFRVDGVKALEDNLSQNPQRFDRC